MLIVRNAHPYEFDEVQEFYSSVGYTRAIAAGDRIVIAIRDEKIIGALKLAVEQNHTVLRSLYVAKDSQRKGIGRRLLAESQKVLRDKDCYSVPYAHLMKLYEQAGFKLILPTEAPKFLAERMDNYQRSGLKVCLMKKDADSVQVRASWDEISAQTAATSTSPLTMYCQ